MPRATGFWHGRSVLCRRKRVTFYSLLRYVIVATAPSAHLRPIHQAAKTVTGTVAPPVLHQIHGSDTDTSSKTGGRGRSDTTLRIVDALTDIHNFAKANDTLKGRLRAEPPLAMEVRPPARYIRCLPGFTKLRERQIEKVRPLSNDATFAVGSCSP